MGGPAYQALLAQIELIRRFQSNEGMTLMDADDAFEGPPVRLQRPGQRPASVRPADIRRAPDSAGAPLRPVARRPELLRGFDLRTYYDNVANGADKQLRPGLSVLLDVVHRSSLGREPDDQFGFTFRPLWQLSDTEKATIAKDNESAVSDAYDKGNNRPQTALSELREASHVTGVFSTITEEQIDAADDDPPDPGEVDILWARYRQGPGTSTRGAASRAGLIRCARGGRDAVLCPADEGGPQHRRHHRRLPCRQPSAVPPLTAILESYSPGAGRMGARRRRSHADRGEPARPGRVPGAQ